MTEFRRSRQRRSWSEPVVEVAGGAGCGSRPLARESTGYPSPLLPPRRFRGGREVPIHVPRGARDEHHNAVLADGVVMETDGRGRLAWAEGGRAAWGSRPSVTLAACSVALLAFLSNRVSAFHPVAPPTRRIRGDSRKHPRAYAPCRNYSDDLLQGSFTGRLGREARRVPYFWGLGWVACVPSRGGPLDMAPVGGSGGGGGGIGDGGGNQSRGVWGSNRGRSGRRGNEGVRRPSPGAGGGIGGLSAASSSMPPVSSTSGARRREAHSTAQAPMRETEAWSPPSPPASQSQPPTPPPADPNTLEAFPLIVEALSAFKRIKGHLNVPPRFEVPMEAPWPEDLGGMELGKKISQLRNDKQTYVAKYPDRVQMLRSLGFEWDKALLPDEWDLIRMGLEGYFRKHGHTRVPVKFVVPADSGWPEEAWGHKLGARVNQMRQSGKHMGNTPEEKEERLAILNKLGFDARLKNNRGNEGRAESEEEFDILCEALQIYRSLGGFVPNMPPTFIVPDQDPWPLRTRQFPLGYELRAIRSNQKYVKGNAERVQALTKLDVPLTPVVETGSPTDLRFDKIIAAFECYKQVFGSVEVPLIFEVPPEYPWPEFTWGTKLGRSLYNIAYKGTFVTGYPERAMKLENLGFDTDPRGLRGNVAKNVEMDVMRNSMSIDGIDYGSVTPEALPGIDTGSLTRSTTESELLMGSVLQDDRARRRKDSLRAPPVDGELGDDFDDKLLEDLARADGLPGFMEGGDFGDEEETGMEILGAETSSNRFLPQEPLPAWKSNGTDAEVLALMSRDVELFFESKGANLDYWPEEFHHIVARKTIAKLGTYARGFNQVLDLEGPIGTKLVELPGVLSPEQWDPKSKNERSKGYRDRDDYYGDFGMSEEDDDEGESGMIDRQYGRRLVPGCSTAASGLDWCTDEVRERILEVGFEWDEFGDGFLWDDVFQGLTIYKDVFGELPRDNFVVPNDGEWPQELVGMQLGSFCRQMRIGDIWAKHHEERRRALDELGFNWGDDSLYLYFQWAEVLIAFYSIRKLKGHLDVTPNYVIPEEDPWPLPLQGFPAGYYLNVVRAQKDLLMEHYPERFATLRGLGVEWIDPTFVDWMEEGSEDVYEYWEWGKGRLGASEDENGIQPPSISPDFAVQDL